MIPNYRVILINISRNWSICESNTIHYCPFTSLLCGAGVFACYIVFTVGRTVSCWICILISPNGTNLTSNKSFLYKKNRINWSNVKEYYFLVHLYQRIRIYLALLTMTMVTCTKTWPKTTQTFFRESNGEHPTVFYNTEFCHVTLLRIIYGAVELICE